MDESELVAVRVWPDKDRKEGRAPTTLYTREQVHPSREALRVKLGIECV